MDKREQVFVSSTYLDLREEREKVIQGLLEADCFPAGMELFPASDEEKWDLIKGVIDDSDYYLLIIGGRYGAEDDITQISYTEMEYDYAVEQGKPVMAFIHEDPDQLPAGKTDKNDEKSEKLVAFRNKVMARMVKLWTNGDQLPGFVAQSIIKLRKSTPAVGWVRGDQAMTPETRAELAQLRAEIAELRAQAISADTQEKAPVFHDLEDGEDNYSFNADIRIKYWEPSGDDNAPADDETVKDPTIMEGTVSGAVDWNTLFGMVGPTLLQEASEHRLEETLRRELHQFVEQERPDLDDFHGEVDFQRILIVDISTLVDDVVVQLLALRLIERGVLKRTVADRNRYWKLTEAGEERMMQLRARRRFSDQAISTDT